MMPRSTITRPTFERILGRRYARFCMVAIAMRRALQNPRRPTLCRKADGRAMLGAWETRRTGEVPVKQFPAALLLGLLLCAALVVPRPTPAQTAPFAVTTYHYNKLRTGWNSAETVLSAAA